MPNDTVAVTLYDGPGTRRTEGRKSGRRKVSCGFAHPIIRTTTTTLVLDAPEEVSDMSLSVA